VVGGCGIELSLVPPVVSLAFGVEASPTAPAAGSVPVVVASAGVESDELVSVADWSFEELVSVELLDWLSGEDAVPLPTWLAESAAGCEPSGVPDVASGVPDV
jgi:hypothetical protein